MVKFIQLVNHTTEGIEEFEGIPERLEKAKSFSEDMGVTIEDYYVTLGQYDAVVIVDAPDAKTAAVGTIWAEKFGTSETETLTAFDEEEVEDIIEALPQA